MCPFCEEWGLEITQTVVGKWCFHIAAQDMLIAGKRILSPPQHEQVPVAGVVKTNRLRQIAKGIPPLYWLAGLLKYVRFQFRMRQADRIYSRGGRPKSPPPMLRYRVHGALDEASYLNVANLTAATLAECFARHGVALEGLTVLDFGCGPGRVTSELKRLTDACRFFGSDIDKEAIDWARTNLHDTGSFDVNAAIPPTKHASGFFDVVYSV